MIHGLSAKRAAWFAMLAMTAVPACSHLHPAPQSVPSGEASPPASESPPPSTPAPPAEEPEKPAGDSGAENPPATSGGAAACTCASAESKHKPRYRPKPKVVHREAPPQLPTAPVVAETPPGGVVNAQVKEMPVSVMSILGKRVQGPKGDDLGRVVDVLADATGRVRVAIIDFGGFLGVGDRRIAVDWPLLKFNTDGGDPSLLLSVSRDKLKGAPEYKDNRRPQTLMEPESPAAPTQPAVTAQPADVKK